MRFFIYLATLCGVLMFSPVVRAGTSFSMSSGSTTILASDSLIPAGEHFNKVVVLWGNIDFRGQADEMLVIAGHVKLRRGARISEKLTIMGGSLDQEDGASVAGDMATIQAPEGWYRTLFIFTPVIGALFSGGLWFISAAFWILSSWGMGLLCFYLFPGFAKRSAKIMREQKTLAFFWALLSVLLFVPGLVFLVVSILGIALIPLYIALYGLSYYFAHLVGAAWLGNRLNTFFRRAWGWPLQLLLGVALSIFIGTLLPVFGKFFLFFLTFIALGAVLRAWHVAFWGEKR